MTFTDLSKHNRWPGAQRFVRRALGASDVANAALAAGADEIGAWQDASEYRRCVAVAVGNGTLNVSVHVELDYSGDGAVDESLDGTAGTTSRVSHSDMLARQVRIRVRNEDGVSAQDVSGTLLLSD